jgi:hypothetical protein
MLCRVKENYSLWVLKSKKVWKIFYNSLPIILPRRNEGKKKKSAGKNGFHY